MPVPLGYQQVWQSSASNSGFLPQTSQKGYTESHAHPKAAMHTWVSVHPGFSGTGSSNVRPANAIQQHNTISTPALPHDARGSNMASAVLRPSQAASGQVRSSSAPVRCGPGQGAPDMRPHALGQHNHVQYVPLQVAPAACLATRPFSSQSNWVHGRPPVTLGLGQAFQQPLQQFHGRATVQHCVSVSASTGQRGVSAPAAHSHVSAQCGSGYPSIPQGPPRPLGTMARNAMPVSDVLAGTQAHAPQPSTDFLPSQLQTSTQGRRAHTKSGPTLTAEQQQVVDRALAWDDYVLVMGLPGAGKTYTIAACVQVCMHEHNSVVPMW